MRRRADSAQRRVGTARAPEGITEDTRGERNGANGVAGLPDRVPRYSFGW
jgi:hypothetical protein